MRNYLFKKFSLLFVAGVFCLLFLVGCNKQQTNKDSEVNATEDSDSTIQLLGFETYEEVVGTKLRLRNAMGRMSINSKKDFISEGNGSLMVAPQGDYNRQDEWHPYIEFGCIDSTIITRDFSKMKEISMDIYNNSDKELHVAISLTVPTLIGRTNELPEQVYALQPKQWTTCRYDLSEPTNGIYWDMENIEYIKVSFLEHKTSKEDVPNELYLDNLVGTYFKDGESIADWNFDFHEGIAFNQDEDLYAFRSRDYDEEAKIELSRISYKDEGVEAESQMGEYGMKGVVTPEGFWPGIDIVYNEVIPANSVLSFMAYVQVDKENYNDDITYDLNSHEASVYSENGEHPLNTWFEVHILIPEETTRTNIFFNFCSGVSETGEYIFMYGDDNVIIYMDNFLVTQGHADVEEKDGVVTLRNFTGQDIVKYDLKRQMKKGDGLTFDIDFNTSEEITVYVLAEGVGEGDNVFWSMQNVNWNEKVTVKCNALKDVNFVQIYIEYHGDGDKTKNICTIENIGSVNYKDYTVSKDGTVKLYNTGNSTHRTYNINHAVKEGDLVSLKLDFDKSEELTVWVLADGRMQGDNVFWSMENVAWDGEQWAQFVAQKDASYMQIYILYYDTAGKSQNTCTIRDVCYGNAARNIVLNNNKKEAIQKFNIGGEIKAGDVVTFDIDFAKSEDLGIWVLAEGQSGGNNEFWSKRAVWNGKQSVQFEALKDVSHMQIYIVYFGSMGSEKNTCTISNYNLAKTDRKVVITQNNCHATGYNTNNKEWYMIYDLMKSVSKGKSLTFDLTLPELTTDAAVFAELYDYDDNLLESTFVLSNWSKESSRTLTFQAPCDADYVRITISYRQHTKYPGDAIVSRVKVMEGLIVTNSNCVVSAYNTDSEQWNMVYDLQKALTPGKELTFNVSMPDVGADIAVYAEGYAKDGTLVQESVVLSEWLTQTERQLTFKSNTKIDYVRLVFSYRGIEAYPGECVISNINIAK